MRSTNLQKSQTIFIGARVQKTLSVSQKPTVPYSNETGNKKKSTRRIRLSRGLTLQNLQRTLQSMRYFILILFGFTKLLGRCVIMITRLLSFEVSCFLLLYYNKLKIANLLKFVVVIFQQLAIC